MRFEEIFTLLFVLYLVGSVVAAVLKRAMRGPAPENHRPWDEPWDEAEEAGEPQEARPAWPPVAPEPSVPAPAPAPRPAWEAIEPPAAPGLPAAADDGLEPFFEPEEALLGEELLAEERLPPGLAEGPEHLPRPVGVGHLVLSPATVRQGVVLAEILGKPRALRPCRPPFLG